MSSNFLRKLVHPNPIYSNSIYSNSISSNPYLYYNLSELKEKKKYYKKLNEKTSYPRYSNELIKIEAAIAAKNKERQRLRYYSDESNNIKKYETTNKFDKTICYQYTSIPKVSDANYSEYHSNTKKCIVALQDYKQQIRLANNHILQMKKDINNLNLPQLRILHQKLKGNENKSFETLTKLKAYVENLKIKSESVEKSSKTYGDEMKYANDIETRYKNILEYAKEAEHSSNRATSKTLDLKYNEINDKLKVLLEKRKKANLLAQEYHNQITLFQKEIDEKQKEKNVIEITLNNFNQMLNSFSDLLQKEIQKNKKVNTTNTIINYDDHNHDHKNVPPMEPEFQKMNNNDDENNDQMQKRKINIDQEKKDIEENQILKQQKLKTKELSSILHVLNANLATATTHNKQPPPLPQLSSPPLFMKDNNTLFKTTNNNSSSDYPKRVQKLTNSKTNFEVPDFLKPSHSLFDNSSTTNFQSSIVNPFQTTTTTLVPPLTTSTINKPQKKSIFLESPLREDIILDEYD